MQSPIDIRARESSRISDSQFRKVRQAFPTDAQLKEASEEDFKAKGVSQRQATEIRRMVHRKPSTETEEDRVPIWDTERKRKLAGRAAPKRSGLADYLTKNPRYQEYSNQDAEQAAVIPAAAAEDEAASVDCQVEVSRVKEEFAGCVDAFCDFLEGLRDEEDLKRREIFSGIASEIYEEAKSLRDDLRREVGHEAALLGTNGLGKTTLINMMLLLSSTDSSSYIEMFKAGHKMESLEAYSHIPDECPKDNILVESAPLFTKEQAVEAEQQRLEGSEKLRKFSRGEAMDRKEQTVIPEYLLPAGNDANVTTALDTPTHYGVLPHILLKMKTLDQSKKDAFKYCQQRADHEKEGMEFSDLEREDQDVLETSWKHYVAVTEGRVVDEEASVGESLEEDSDHYLSLDKLPESWQEVEVHQSMLQWIAPNSEADPAQPCYRIYSGRITEDPRDMSLDLDRKFVHDKLAAFMDAGQIHRFGIESPQSFYPSYVLEGGNSLRDLPGTNDNSVENMVITEEAVSSAKLIFVLLAKNLKADKATCDMLEKSRAIEHLLSDRDNYQIVFLHCREKDRAVYTEGLLSAKNAEIEQDAEKATRQQFYKLLKMVNSTLKGDKLDDDALQKLKEEAHVKTIYPLLYTSLMLRERSINQDNGLRTREFAIGTSIEKQFDGTMYMGKVVAYDPKTDWYKIHYEDGDEEEVSTEELEKITQDKIKDKTNMKWMLGILEKLNQDNIQHGLERFAENLIPKLENKLTGVHLDASEGGVSAALLEGVKKLLKSKDQFRNHAESVATKVLQPLQIEFQKDLPSEIEEFTKPISQHLPEPAESKASWEKALKAKKGLKRLSSFHSALSPETHGRSIGRNGLIGIVYGTEQQRQIDFEPLRKSVEEMLTAGHNDLRAGIETQIDEILSAMPDGIDVPQVLRQTYFSESLPQLLTARFDRFWSSRVPSRHKTLGDRYKSVTRKLRQKALQKSILSQAQSASASVSELVNEIGDTLSSGRCHEEYMGLLNRDLTAFIKKQFTHLSGDLNQRLIKKSLEGFFYHVVQVGTSDQGDGTIMEQIHMLKAVRDVFTDLVLRTKSRQEAEEIGDHVQRHLIRLLQDESLGRAAKTVEKLPIPATTQQIAVKKWRGAHRLWSGVLKEADFESAGSLKPLEAKLKGCSLQLRSCSIDLTATLFEVVVELMYPQKATQATTDSLQKHVQMHAHRYFGNITARSKFEEATSTSPAYYIDAVQRGSDEAGMFSLYWCGQICDVSFRVWQAGQTEPTLILGPRDLELRKKHEKNARRRSTDMAVWDRSCKAFNLVVHGGPGGEKSFFTCSNVARSRRVSFNSTVQTKEVPTGAADVEARKPTLQVRTAMAQGSMRMKRQREKTGGSPRQPKRAAIGSGNSSLPHGDLLGFMKLP
jgi:hypothetical protein